MKTVVQKIFREQFENCFDDDVKLIECFLTAYDQLKTIKSNHVVDFVKTFRYYDIFDLRNLVNNNKSFNIKSDIKERIATNIEIVGRDRILQAINLYFVEINEGKDTGAGSYF